MSVVTHVSDPRVVRATFAQVPSGVAALAATVDGIDHVLVASTFTVGVSLDPPLVMFAVQRTSSTWPRLRMADRIGISVLGTDQGELCRRLAGPDRAARLHGVPLERALDDAIFVRGASVWMGCRVHAEHPAGDHDVVVLEVVTLESDDDVDPLVFHGSRFRALD
ncbi:flavin reductase family protein [Georgenia ruanii]|uniref:Flavin reductase n=1 Tax=Georgenia ruanii TaxID=348442 RepID=A0A7J9V0X3_9MICO|nr:flavin reductase family protein [Georgenia ruanii]MPV90535.1 flavin reductase [Georgenia ruanii]